jgi:DNA (cytosine-5)-methyltransferase 1
MSEFTSVSTFSGVGGMDYGLECAGVTTVAQCEIDDWRRRVLEHHWPGVERFDDVRTMYAGAGTGGEPAGRAAADGLRAPGDERRREARAGIPSGVDLLHGGFPCQDLSVAGNRRGLAGNRSGLFYEFARLADAIRPTWLLIENVPGLLSSDDGRDFGIVLHALAELGYGLAWRVLDARYFGVPQRRRRVFVVGHIGGDRRSALSALCESCEGSPEAIRCSWQEVAKNTPQGALGHGEPALSLTRRHAGSSTARDGVDNLVAGSASEMGIAATLASLTGGPRTTDIESATFVVTDAAPTSQPTMDVSPALTAHHKRLTGPDEAMVAAPLTKGSAASPGVNPPGRRQEDDVNLVSFHLTQDPISSNGATPAMSKGNGDGCATIAAATPLGVRRLTPVECERLMGWPDGWTAPAGLKSPDSRRYAACGDGVVANVAEWIGRRLLAVHAENLRRADG